MSYFNLEPTVVPTNNFVAIDDAKALRKAMTGMGTNENTIINILTRRSNEQRQQISTAFTKEFDRDLKAKLQSELSGDFQTLMLALMETPISLLANELQRAMKGLGTNENVLTEILCTHSTSDLTKVATVYQETFGDSLDAAIQNEVSGDYKRLLRLLLTNSRDEGGVDPTKTKDLAERLYAAGEGKLGTDEETFLLILSRESFQQIKSIMEEYQKYHEIALEDAVKKEFSGDLLEAILTILKCAKNQNLYFAEQIEQTMKGMGTSDKSLIRIIVSRSELDLEGIKREFQKLYGKTLQSAIEAETSGDYQKALLSLIGTG